MSILSGIASHSFFRLALCAIPRRILRCRRSGICHHRWACVGFWSGWSIPSPPWWWACSGPGYWLPRCWWFGPCQESNTTSSQWDSCRLFPLLGRPWARFDSDRAQTQYTYLALLPKWTFSANTKTRSAPSWSLWFGWLRLEQRLDFFWGWRWHAFFGQTGLSSLIWGRFAGLIMTNPYHCSPKS